MKSRSQGKAENEPTSELRGVVKKMTGRLTSDPKLEQEGDQEMDGSEAQNRPAPAKHDPDPHRRG